MKFHLNQAEGLNLFTGYGDGHVFVNQQRHDETSLVVTPEDILRDWCDAGYEQLSPAHFAILRDLHPEVALLGTGTQQRFPHPRLTAPLIDAGIGLEVMDTRAACRTYNILAAEGRRVAIALLWR
ncbi:MAG: Mth938-like domain-containing protein [Betaproteobacteria bacterium]|nr:Mth938-like domain-containing protein [Betaproteobacteria bacterium]